MKKLGGRGDGARERHMKSTRKDESDTCCLKADT